MFSSDKKGRKEKQLCIQRIKKKTKEEAGSKDYSNTGVNVAMGYPPSRKMQQY